MLTSVHIADVGAGAAVSLLVRRLGRSPIAGLRHAEVGVAAPLSPRLVGTPQPGRVVVVGFWDDLESIERFESTHPRAGIVSSGWRALLEPVRRHGSWPGLDDMVPTPRGTPIDGPVVVLTLGHLRVGRAAAFLRASAKAEGRAIEAPGMLWTTGFARPPFVATCSV